MKHEVFNIIIQLSKVIPIETDKTAYSLKISENTITRNVIQSYNNLFMFLLLKFILSFSSILFDKHVSYYVEKILKLWLKKIFTNLKKIWYEWNIVKQSNKYSLKLKKKSMSYQHKVHYHKWAYACIFIFPLKALMKSQCCRILTERFFSEFNKNYNIGVTYNLKNAMKFQYLMYCY